MITRNILNISELNEKADVDCSIIFTHLYFHLDPIYRPTQSIKPTKEQISRKQQISTKEQISRSSLNVMATSVSSVLVPVIPSHEAHSSRMSMSSPSLSPTMGSARNETEKRPCKRDQAKQNVCTILVCGIGGGIFLAMTGIALTVIIYLKRY